MKKNAFSLVEVTIALGLVTFAAVSVIGMLPTGLVTLRDAANENIATQITREISAELLLTPYEDLDDYADAGPRYYNAQGERTDDSNAYFRTELALADSEFPGSTTANTLTNSIRCIRIKIISRAFANSSATTNQRMLQVANSGY